MNFIFIEAFISCSMVATLGGVSFLILQDMFK